MFLPLSVLKPEHPDKVLVLAEWVFHPHTPVKYLESANTFPSSPLNMAIHALNCTSCRNPCNTFYLNCVRQYFPLGWIISKWFRTPSYNDCSYLSTPLASLLGHILLLSVVFTLQGLVSRTQKSNHSFWKLSWQSVYLSLAQCFLEDSEC